MHDMASQSLPFRWDLVSFRPERWLANAEGPDRGDRTRQALAEAVALVAYGRSGRGAEPSPALRATNRHWLSPGSAPSSQT